MATVSENSIIGALREVPRERWRDVLHYIESLKGAEEAGPRPVRTGTDLRGSALIGVWAGRSDLGDSREYARRLREQASHRRRRDRSDAP